MALTALMVQVSICDAQVLYQADGEPTAIEEEIRWLLNRARASRSRENAIRGTSYSDVPQSLGPLAPNALLARAARRHCQDMAAKGRFQHETVSGSAFYNPRTHPMPWDRMRAEGYVWNVAGENIAAGYESGTSVHVGWWKSAGHRVNMMSRDFCEVGVGYHYRSNSEYIEYYDTKLARSGDQRFFTGTLFEDVSRNRSYSRNEGRAGVRVELVVAGVTHPHYDVSATHGSFAIPIREIAQGAMVQVMLTNATDRELRLSIPRTAADLELVVLAPGDRRPWGQFVRSDLMRNYGFRDAAAPGDFVVLNRSYQEFGPVGGPDTLTVDANTDWTAESTVPWLRVTAGMTGSGPGQVGFEVLPQDFGDPRTGTLVVRGSSGVTRVVTVRQEGLPTELALTAPVLRVPWAGLGLWEAQVAGNVTWRVETTAHWLRFEGGTGVGSQALSGWVAPNLSTQERSLQVRVTGGGVTREVTVVQEAGPERGVAEPLNLDLAEGVGTVLSVVGLPQGLTWDAGVRRLVGQATVAGTYRLRVRVRNPDGRVETRTVTVLVRPLPVWAVGEFQAWLPEPTGVSALGAGEGLGGDVVWRVGTGGGLTGTLRLAGKNHALRGRISHRAGGVPEVDLAVRLSGQESLNLRLELGSDDRVTGVLSRPGMAETQALRGWRRGWHSQSRPVPAAKQGRFHVLKDLAAAWLNDASVPQGAGFAVMSVKADGQWTWSGKLGDGTACTRSGFLSPTAEFQLWVPLYGQRGSWMTSGTVEETSRVVGEGSWIKLSGGGQDTSYRAGFGTDARGPVGLVLSGERWTPAAMGPGRADAPKVMLRLDFEGGAMAETSQAWVPLPFELNLETRRMVLPKAGPDLRLPTGWAVSWNPATGVLAGSWLLSDPHPSRPGSLWTRRVTFRGLLLPGRLLAAGQLLGPKSPVPGVAPETLAGLMLLERVPEP